MTAEIRRAVLDLLRGTDIYSTEGTWSESAERAACERLADGGWLSVGLPEELGGSGGDLHDAAAVAAACAAAGHRLPAADAGLITGHVLAVTGLRKPPGLVLPVPVAGTLRGGRLRAQASRVPFARWATTLLIVADDGASLRTCLVDAGAADITAGHNLAGEPRDAVVIDTAIDTVVINTAIEAAVMDTAIIDGAVSDGAVMDTAVIDGAAADSGRPAAAGERPAAGAGAGRDVRGQLHRAGALARAIQMAAAIERMLELTVAYCGERRQFGRSLAQFQAVQQQLALLAGEALAARGAVQRALALLGPGEWAAEPVAVAKVRTGMAATVAARIAHQLHGAMGITTEHALHRFTVPAWSWREEYGNERHWSEALAAECGSELWEAVTAVS